MTHSPAAGQLTDSEVAWLSSSPLGNVGSSGLDQAPLVSVAIVGSIRPLLTALVPTATQFPKLVQETESRMPPPVISPDTDGSVVAVCHAPPTSLTTREPLPEPA